MASNNDCNNDLSTNAYSPREMACKAETVGVAKANLDFLSTFVLAVMAGAFIAFAACLYTTAITGMPRDLFGPARLLGGLSFCLGLILVVVAGAELFTGNTLIIIATVSGKVRFSQLLRNWLIVYVGNLVGSLAVVILIYYAMQWKMGDMAVGVTAYNIAAKKLTLPFFTAFCSGILCNALVCLAIWLCYSARSTTDKILSIIFPITAFVALGFEHSVANMYFIPYGIMLALSGDFTSNPAVVDVIKSDPSIFTISNCIANLVPVTLGNIVGGAILVGLVYWIVYLRGEKRDLFIERDELPEEVISGRR